MVLFEEWKELYRKCLVLPVKSEMHNNLISAFHIDNVQLHILHRFVTLSYISYIRTM